jgi:glucose-1-phosphate thymidylyltransferase
MYVLILAGGFATRLWPLTEKRAKPLLQLAGKSLIAHLIDKIPADLPIIISTNQVFEDDFEELKEKYSDRDISVFIEDSASDKAKKGALAATALVIEKKKLDKPLMLLAGDNYFDFDLKDFIESYEEKPILAVYDTKSLNEAKKFGVVTLDGKKVAKFTEKPDEPDSTMVSTGCYVFPSSVFPEIIEYSKSNNDNLGGIFEHLLEKQEVQAYPFEGKWIDIGSFQAYLGAHKELYSESRLPITSMIKRSDIGNCVSVGERSRIIDSHVENSVVGDDCVIKDCQIKNSVIDNGCRLEGIDLDHKMIRAESEIRG